MEAEAKKSYLRPGAILLLLAAAAVTALVYFTLADRAGAQVIGHVNQQSVTMELFEEEILLQRVRDRLADRAVREDNLAASLNQMIGDLLLLQEAAEAEVTIEQTEVESEVEAVLDRVNSSRGEMEQLLTDEGLDWDVFERSIREYLTIRRYQEDVLLAVVPATERSTVLQDWMSASYALAEIEFDPDFLEDVNAGIFPLAQGQDD
jgi:parvulin-like peptidyl-prolyl isomerase